MRELCGYKPSRRSSCASIRSAAVPSSSVASSIVARAVAKIEKGEPSRSNAKNSCQSDGATSDATCDVDKQLNVTSSDSGQLSDDRNLSDSCHLANFPDSVGFSYERELTVPHDFETALADFDRTAEDVLTFVQERSDRLLSRNITANNSRRSRTTNVASDSSSSDGEDGNTSDSDSCTDDSSASSKNGRDLATVGLDTIAEEIAQTQTSLEETDVSAPEEEDSTTIQLCKPVVFNSCVSDQSKEPTWIDLAAEECLSSTESNKSTQVDDSSTETEDINESKDSSSTRCNGDFQWIRKDLSPKPNLTMDPDDVLDVHTSPTNNNNNNNNQRSVCVANDQNGNKTKPPINRKSQSPATQRHRRSAVSPTASLDRRRFTVHAHRYDRDQKSRSQHVNSSPPPQLDDYTINQREYSPMTAPNQSGCGLNWCGCSPQTSPSHNLTPNPPMYLFNHQQQQQQHRRYAASGPILLDTDAYRGQHRSSNVCCPYHGVVVAPPVAACCGYHGWLPPMVKPGELDDRWRKLQSERDNLQLQVQVLSEQIEAQCDRIGDLEKRLGEKKHALSNAEDILQRETLSRSSLETQKLELISQLSELKLHQAAIERENLELRCHYKNTSGNTDHHHHHHGNVAKQLPAYLHRMSPQSTVAPSTPTLHNQGVRTCASASPLNISNMASSNRQDITPKTPPATYKRHIDLHYSSLPRQQYLSNGGSLTLVNCVSLPQQQQQQQCGSGLGRLGEGVGMGVDSGGAVYGCLRLKGHSVPNLADTEKVTIDDSSSTLPVTNANDLQLQSFSNSSKSGGMKKLFGKLKRSGSGNLDDLPPGLGVGEFQRGGVRATASPRLGWTEPHFSKNPPSLKPFADWETSHLCEWFSDLGLDQYVAEVRRWLKSGQQLQEASAADYEKELQMKSALHRKKLQLALIDAEANGSSDTLLAQAGKLDTAWVLRWLDDVGLPQYKEAFLQQRVDGRVLHRLTTDDLATLHVTSALHAASLRRGIQVLRERRYDAACLLRRAVEGEEGEGGQEDDDGGATEPKKQNSARSAREISVWSSHRVMQWLREVDLAEYAPNLRGAGVHGAIMVLEQRFTADLLAALLSISPGKTLLRRHLNTRFKELLGADLIQAKREAEAVLGYVALTPQAKIKVAKKSHFSLKRSKSRSEADYGDLVCPMNGAGQSGQDLNGCAINSAMGMTKKIREKEEDVYQHDDQSNSYPQSATNSPLPLRYESS